MINSTNIEHMWTEPEHGPLGDTPPFMPGVYGHVFLRENILRNLQSAQLFLQKIQKLLCQICNV